MAKSDILVRWKADTSNYDANIAKAKRTLNGFKQDNLSMGGVLAQGARSLTAYASSVMSATAAIGALTSAIASNVQTARQFEKSMSVLSSLTGKTGEDLNQLKEYAIELGGSTTLTASQVADAFRLIGSQQPQLLSSSEALKEVTKQAIILSEAAGIDLSTAAQTLSTSVNQMGGNSANAERYVNVLAAASQKGAGDIAWLGEAITKSATAAKAVGTDYEELVANLEQLAKAGFDASTAGTALRSIIMSLERQSNDEFKPSVVGLTQAFANLQAAQLTLTDYQGTAGKMFAAQAMSLAENAEAAKRMAEEITGTATATEQAGTNVANLDGALKSLSSAWEALNLHINSSNGFLKDAVVGLTDVVRCVDTLVTSTSNLSGKLAGASSLLMRFGNSPGLKVIAAMLGAGAGFTSQGGSGTAGAALGGGFSTYPSQGKGGHAPVAPPAGDLTTDAGIKDRIKALKEERDAVQRDSQEYANLTAELMRLQSLLPSNARPSSRTEPKTMSGGIQGVGDIGGLMSSLDPVVQAFRDKMMQALQRMDAAQAAGDAGGYFDARREANSAQKAMTSAQVAVGFAVSEDALAGLKEEVDAAMSKLSENIQPIEIKTAGKGSAKIGKETMQAWQSAAAAVNNVGSALQSLEDPSAKIAGIVGQAVANIALGFAQAAASPATGAAGVWGWIAAATAGLATMVATIASIKNVTKGYAEGGIVPGNSYSGDNQWARLNAGEVILNRAQAANVASSLQSDGMQGYHLETVLSGEDLRVVLNRNSVRRGRGEYVTSRR